jgi:predicted nucleic acid-binding protein
LLGTPASERVSRVIFAANQTLHVPHLIDLEVAQVLRRYASLATISAERGAEALSDFLDLPLTRYPHFVLLSRVWQLRHQLTAYDAAYLALAEVLDAPLITRDRALARARGPVRVELV